MVNVVVMEPERGTKIPCTFFFQKIAEQTENQDGAFPATWKTMATVFFQGAIFGKKQGASLIAM